MWLPSHAVDVVVSGSRLERRTVVGESPVRGPPSKPEYYPVTDSGPVP